jgi:site-specific DNA-methyltransferase (adenine-specific)
LFRKSSIASPENQGIHDGYQRPWKQDPQKVAEANERTQEKSAVADRLGRWPANVILDEYSAEVLDEQSGISKSVPFQSDGKKHFSRSMSGGAKAFSGSTHNDSGGASRFFYVAKASKRDRNEGLDELPLRKSDQRSEVAAGLWAEMEAPKQNFHPTVKPTQLMRYLVKLVTPLGGTVLDPFTGSGSTGKAAILEGFRFIGCELTEDYIPIIEGRLKHAEAMKQEAEEKKDEALF